MKTKALLMAVAMSTLTACGGGGGGSSTDTIISYTVSATAGTGGTITPASVSVNQGETTILTVTPDTNNLIDSVSGCGGTLDGTSYTTAAVTGDCTVTASFNLITPPAAPSLSLTPQSVKTFAFSWADVSGETEYRLLENPDGSSGFTQVASIAADATSHDLEVFLPSRINASYMLQACNSSGCTGSTEVFVSGSLAEAVGYVKASNTYAGDYFGISVALAADGNTLAVGAYGEDSNATGIDGDQTDNSASSSGAVYLFARSAGNWSQQAYLKAANAEGGDTFGRSVALADDGNTLAVGAYGEDSNATGIDGNQADNSAADSGAVYLFTRSAGNWSQQVYLKAANTETGDNFGIRVALAADGNTLAVVALYEDSNATGIDGDQTDNSAADSGAVYLFARSAGNWSQQAYLKAANTEADDGFGMSLTLAADGNTLAVGANSEDSNATGIDGNQADNSAADSGAVYLFTRSAGNWSQQAYLKAANAEAGDTFGRSVSLAADGNTLAVGATGEDSNATGIDGDQTDNSAAGSGAVYLFARSAGNWSQQAYLKASNTGDGDVFGVNLALAADGNTLAVASTGEDSNATGIDGDQTDNSASFSGAVYLFTLSAGNWSQQGYLKASNTEAGDGFSMSLSLAADGNTLAVGAWSEDGNATGIDGNQADNTYLKSGAVYLY